MLTVSPSLHDLSWDILFDQRMEVLTSSNILYHGYLCHIYYIFIIYVFNGILLKSI